MRLNCLHEDQRDVDRARAETRDADWAIDDATSQIGPESDVDVRIRPDLPFPLDPRHREIFDPQGQIYQVLKAYNGQATWPEIWSNIQSYLTKLTKYNIPTKSHNEYKEALNQMIANQIVNIKRGQLDPQPILSLSI